MLSATRRKSLSHMYSLVGTHSAVKLCRWQKSMLRGLGGCYKWTMYGIQSHRCMEATPSLACANKCTFCWRLNSNPTTKDWKWDVDDPVSLVDTMVDTHKSLVLNAQGMPGVTPERLTEAVSPSHCALSLVGEPIIYPKINAFVAKLHRNGISSFLVNNGQFPDAIAALEPVTQLYLSVDAPNRAKMKELDRPIFDDFWERFNQSVDEMRKKKHRTTFRLTMIEGHNMFSEDIASYQEMLVRGNPHFIELKQLTPAFQGRKTESPLRMKNVPTWERILSFGQQLCHGLPYAVACAHVHSSCLLLARNDFKLDGVDADGKQRWQTWIDFPKFNRMILEYQKNRGNDDLSASSSNGSTLVVPDAKDYCVETPSWAVIGAKEEGFDPKQERRYSTKWQKHLDAEKQEALRSAEA